MISQVRAGEGGERDGRVGDDGLDSLCTPSGPYSDLGQDKGPGSDRDRLPDWLGRQGWSQTPLSL